MDPTKLLTRRKITAALLVGGLFVAGCGKEKEPGGNAPPGSAVDQFGLSVEFGRFVKRPGDPNPDFRPRVLSERAPDRREWALRALRRGYEESGHTNIAWDAAARSAFEAYADYSRVSTTNWPTLLQALHEVVRTGCDDAMVQYMGVRYEIGGASTNADDRALAFLKAQDALLQSRHHPVFKFTAGLRASNAASHTRFQAMMGSWRALTTVALEDLARDTNAPSEELFLNADEWLRHGTKNDWPDFVMWELEKILDRDHGDREETFWLKGRTEVKRAWAARGGGYADTVNEKQWKAFEQHLAKAEAALTRAWKMNSNRLETAILMMKVELGQGRGIAREELWFGRAMQLDPDSYEAATQMAFYLQPRWHGSVEEVLVFARECVASTNWAGSVPLVLRDAHHSLAGYFNMSNSPAYWRGPQVWTDVRSSFEKYFQLNPKDFSYRHAYARDAFWCGHYREFLEQTKRFTGGTNFGYFGGEEEFNRMIAKAAAEAWIQPENGR